MGWANRLILGDSLISMASLLERERLAGQVQLVYIDPPYGINYNSNFQARISVKRPKETDDRSVTRQPEQIQAYRDTWSLGVHSYLTYLRQRLVATRDLLAETGSVFVQIGADRMHLVRALLDETFGPENACPLITVRKTSGHDSRLLPETSDFLLWYAKNKEIVKYRPLYRNRAATIEDETYNRVLLADGGTRALTAEERAAPGLLPEGARIYKLDNATSDGFSQHKSGDFEFEGRPFPPGPDKHWKLRMEGMAGLAKAERLEATGKTLWYRRFWDDFGGVSLSNIWMDTSSSFAKRRYVVATVPKIVERCIAMTTDPGDLVLDPTCGSGTTAWASEKLGRRWITIDTSRVALAIARERILTAKYDYYRLKEPARGVDAGFEYRTLSRITASSIGYERDPGTETLFDQPRVESGIVRVAGPFTVEALSRYADNPFEGESMEARPDAGADDHVATLLDALRTMGVPRRGGSPLEVIQVDPISGSGALHAEGRYADAEGTEQLFAVSLGPRHGPITVAQVDEALADAPGYRLIVFAGFAATAEAQEYLVPGRRGRVNVALLEANADLLLGGLLKNTKASQTFRLFAAPETRVIQDGDGTVRVELLGMDSFDAATGEVVSRNQDEIAAWFLDHDYDGSVFHVNQAFFTRNDAWDALGKALKATIDVEAIEAMHSFTSLPFDRGPSSKAAIRVVDDAGQTSEAIIDLGA